MLGLVAFLFDPATEILDVTLLDHFVLHVPPELGSDVSADPMSGCDIG